MSSWKYTLISIRKHKVFFQVFRLKMSKITSKCTLWSTNTCTGFHFTYSEYRRWIKRLFHSMWGGQHSKQYQSKRQNRHLRQSKDSVYSRTDIISQKKDRFLISNRKTYKNDTLTTSKPSLCCEASFKVPLPPLQKPVSDRFQHVHKTGPHIHSLNTFCINSFLNRPF